MGWAEMRIKQFNLGEKANWWEKRWLEHANPVNLILHFLGAIPFIYGLWIHNWLLIILGFLLHKIGHWYCMLIDKKESVEFDSLSSN